MSLAEFLLARIAEDEAAATSASHHSHLVHDYERDNYGFLWVKTTRVLAECEAKRRIVARCTDRIDVTELRDAERRYISGAPDMDMLRLLALPYADHPDCREEWRP